MSDDPVLTGEQAERLLKDEAFLLALTNLEARYIRDWQRAETPTEREVIHARTSVLTDLQTELRKLVGSGQYEAARRKRGRPPKNL